MSACSSAGVAIRAPRFGRNHRLPCLAISGAALLLSIFAAAAPLPPRHEPLNCLRGATEGQVRAVQQAWAKHLGVNTEREIDLGDGVKMKLTLIPPGKFRMGATTNEIDVIVKQYVRPRDVYDDEFPQHDVELTKPYWLGTYTVTQEEFEHVMGRNPSSFTTDGVVKDKLAKDNVVTTRRFPVEGVTWYDAVEFCNKASARLGKKPCYRLSNVKRKDGAIIAADVEMLNDGDGCRLPTEAEWEYACRAGTMTPFHFGMTLNGTEANCNGTYPHGTETKGPNLERPRNVGEQYQPNAFGLHNMHANVWQWCGDWYGPYPSGSVIDPQGAKEASARVLRGGSWFSNARYCRSAYRSRDDSTNRIINIGFRLAIPVR